MFASSAVQLLFLGSPIQLLAHSKWHHYELDYTAQQHRKSAGTQRPLAPRAVQRLATVLRGQARQARQEGPHNHSKCLQKTLFGRHPHLLSRHHEKIIKLAWLGIKKQRLPWFPFFISPKVFYLFHRTSLDFLSVGCENLEAGILFINKELLRGKHLPTLSLK